MSGRALISRWLGRMGYQEALDLQEEIVRGKLADPQSADELLLLEHDPVYTMGRNPDRSSLGESALLPHPVIHINRGGQATYHGPGQLVGYPILDLRSRGQDLHRYLRVIEEVLIEALASWDVLGQRSEGLTGVWVGDRKIASIGVGVRRWTTMHGFALNVQGDLTAFEHITPCGIAGVRMTSVSIEAGRDVSPGEVAARVGEIFLSRLDALLPESASGDAAPSN
jgi:lipoyl(octanoyl) transferase